MSDPFSSSFESLFNAIRISPSVVTIVQESNIFGYLDEDEPLIDHYEAGDLPRLEILPADDDTANLWHSSSTSEIPFTVLVRIKSEDEHVNRTLLGLRWALTRALFTAGIKLGNENVESWELGAFEVTEPVDATKTDRGWSAEAVVIMSLSIEHANITE